MPEGVQPGFMQPGFIFVGIYNFQRFWIGLLIKNSVYQNHI